MTNITDVKVLELANSTVADIAFKNDLDYSTIKDIVVKYIDKKNVKNSVDSLEVLEINILSGRKYLKDFLAVVCVEVAHETRILALQYCKKNEIKEVIEPKIKTRLREEIGSKREIKEWMR
ncbi:MAG: hypothetical protein KAG43_02395 [Candidatus Marithrix sp.]|nr:hypothetical protein [Candidatus Marithrix sp.]